VSDPSKSASTTIRVYPITISVSATVYQIASGGQSELYYSIGNDTANQGATWKTDYGTLKTTDGKTYLSTPLTTPGEFKDITVTATSVSDPSKSASTTIRVYPITISVSATVYQIASGGQSQLFSSVGNDTSNSGVTWSGASAIDKFSASYTGPSVACGAFIDREFTATSVADSSKRATTSIRVYGPACPPPTP
jgi:trimeric autotransporter adhesin